MKKYELSCVLYVTEGNYSNVKTVFIFHTVMFKMHDGSNNLARNCTYIWWKIWSPFLKLIKNGKKNFVYAIFILVFGCIFKNITSMCQCDIIIQNLLEKMKYVVHINNLNKNPIKEEKLSVDFETISNIIKHCYFKNETYVMFSFVTMKKSQLIWWNSKNKTLFQAERNLEIKFLISNNASKIFYVFLYAILHIVPNGVLNLISFGKCIIEKPFPAIYWIEDNVCCCLLAALCIYYSMYMQLLTLLKFNAIENV